MALSRDAILGASDITTREVEVAEWGGSVLIKAMSGAERDGFEASNRNKDGSQDLRNFRARFLVRVIVNEQGTRLFTDAEAKILGEKSSAALNRLWEAAAELNGMGDEATEEIEGNSEETTEDGADSPSS